MRTSCSIYCVYEIPFKGENDRYFYCYKITNTLNGKIYIGVHSTTNLNDGYMGSGKILNRAYKKNGLKPFKKEILKFFENNKTMYEYETKLVTEEFIKRDDTYNTITGGKGGQPGALNHFYGKHHSEKTKRLMSEKSKGRKLSEETKKRLSMNHPDFRLGAHPEAKRIQKLDLTGNIIIEYSCVLVCCENENISRPTLLKYIKNSKPYKGYVYKWSDESNYNKTVNFGKIKRLTGKTHPKSKQIAKIDMNGNVVAIYNTLKEAIALSEYSTPFCIKKSIETGKFYNGYYYKIIKEEERIDE